MDFLNLVLAILGIGFLIFVHELGHFLAAKRVGVRVKTFAIGFQPRIFGKRARFCAFTIGDTEYVIGMIPLGGYVLMAGEETEDEHTGASDEFSSKSTGDRAQVLVAGAVMNLIFGFLLFIAAYSIGIMFASPTVGSVQPQSPAWQAGLRSGDRILAVNGSERGDFANIATSIALEGGSGPVVLDVERSNGGDSQKFSFEVTPRLDPVLGLRTIGISPSATLKLGDVEPDSPAGRAGLKKGETITRLHLSSGDFRASSPLSYTPTRVLTFLHHFLNWHSEGQVTIDVNSQEGSRSVTIELQAPENSIGSPAVGILPFERTIVAIQPGSKANEVLSPGDELISVNGHKITRLDEWFLATVPEGPLATFTTRDGREIVIAPGDFLDWIGEQVIVQNPGSTVQHIGNGCAGELGINVGDHLIQISGQPVDSTSFIDLPLEGGTEILWSSNDQLKKEVVPEGPARRLGVQLGIPATIGVIVDGSPADSVGLQIGDVIVAVDGVQVSNWSAMRTRLHRSDRELGSEVSLLISRGGEEIAVAVTPRALRGPLGISLESDRFLMRTSVGMACSEGWQQSFTWAGRIFLTLRALAVGEVHGKNLAGPIGIVDIGGKVSKQGFGNLLFLLALISINLGIFNLLPFPILDGGHLLFLLFEKVRGKPVSNQIQQWAHLVAFVMLIALALVVTYNDLVRIIVD
ncbi:MAG TPA: RIP metalloprotease RseP [Planctomycetes bacterium]|nr:RIP metalloprotease RseP [Planctomycetota bacterium]